MRQHAQIHDAGDGGPDKAAEAATELGVDDIDEVSAAFAFEQVMQTLIYAVAIVALVAMFVTRI
jgi:hypothetical protein